MYRGSLSSWKILARTLRDCYCALEGAALAHERHVAILQAGVGASSREGRGACTPSESPHLYTKPQEDVVMPPGPQGTLRRGKSQLELMPCGVVHRRSREAFSSRRFGDKGKRKGRSCRWAPTLRCSVLGS